MANEVIPQNDFRSEVANPFGSVNNTTTSVSSVAMQHAASKEMATAQAKIFLAKQFPRDQRIASDKILTACQRLGLAQVATYAYSRGGTAITGPSIRLAEEVARNWGNIECGWNELERGAKTSTVRAYAWDLESNTCKELVFMVPLQRTTKKGTYPLTDERDIYEMLANQASRRLRNCILALVPGDVLEAAVEQCEKTIVSQCDVTPERIKKMVTEFERFGVTKDQIERRIQRKLTAIEPAQFLSMMKIFNSLRDGMSDVSDWFATESVEVKSATDQLKTKLLCETTVEAKTKKDSEKE